MNGHTFRITLISGTALILAALLSAFTLPAAAQAILSPTPDMDGNIYYTVVDNDTCLGVSLKMGVDQNVLKSLNNLDENCTLLVGTRILLGIYETPTPTPGPSPTPTPITPTPTPYLGNADVCIYLFEDINGNALAEETEYGIGGGAVSLSKRNGTENFTGLTTGNDLLCFEEVPEGDYNISVAPPTEYNPTTNMNYPIVIAAGDNTQANFGAQKKAAVDDVDTGVETASTRSPLMAVIGIVFILAGVVIVVIYGIVKRRE